MGEAWIDAVSFSGAIHTITSLVEGGQGGLVVTPNVDHIVQLEHDRALQDAYELADLVLVDGMPIVWASRLLGTPLPAKISGSDLLLPLAQVAASRGWRLYLLGGAPGAAAATGERLSSAYNATIVGVDVPNISIQGDAFDDDAIVARIRDSRPDLVFVAFGSPKQERLAARIRLRVSPAVLVCVGVSFSFVAGHLRRAPLWVSHVGLEWLFRLLHEPRRLWRRYLVKDVGIVRIMWRTSRMTGTLRVQKVRWPRAGDSTPPEAPRPEMAQAESTSGPVVRTP